jgi:hypothetical protein
MVRFPKNNPVAMMPPAVMRNLPFRINNRSFADLNYAITSREPGFLAGLDQLQMGPLVSVIMYIIGNFAE